MSAQCKIRSARESKTEFEDYFDNAMSEVHTESAEDDRNKGTNRLNDELNNQVT